MRRIKLITLITLIFAFTLTTQAQQLKIDRNQLYLFLATTTTTTMQKELDEASSQGFRVVLGSPTTAGEMAIFLERSAQPPENFKYRVLATTLTSTMQKELNEAGAEGFRLVPQIVMAKKQVIGSEIVTVMERSPRSDKHYEYKVLATNLTSTMEKEIAQAQSLGFDLVAMISRVEQIVILEREVPGGVTHNRR